jgi:hypothetical protein
LRSSWRLWSKGSGWQGSDDAWRRPSLLCSLAERYARLGDEERRIVRHAAYILAVVVVLAVASEAPAGGISDDTCPTVFGEGTNTCPSATVGVPYAVRFVESEGAGCGPGQQTFYVDSGVLPPGMTLAADGTLSGTSFVPGSFRFYVEMREPENAADCAGKRTQKQFTLRVRQQPWIVAKPALTPRSEVGESFAVTLRARGGSGIFRWVLASGRLPSGVRVGVAGAIAGSPRTAGRYRFAVRAMDSEGRSVRWETSLDVAPRIRLPHRRLPAAMVGRPYRADLAASGGVAPRSWSFTRGRLPRGLRLASASGRLTGTPKEAGVHAVTIRVRDGLRVEGVRTFRIVVARPSHGVNTAP